MKHLMKVAVCAAMMLAGPVFAGDEMSSDTSISHSKMMKDCMAKQKAKDSSMSKDDNTSAHVVNTPTTMLTAAGI